MQFNTITTASIFVGALLGASTVSANGNVYFYNCNSCNCNAYQDYTDFSGTTPCIAAGGPSGTASAIGLTRDGHQTTCTFYSDNNCNDEFQSAGVNSGQTWGCTAGKEKIGSVKCYYDV